MKTLELKDIKKNQLFREEDIGMVAELYAIEDAHEVHGETRNGYECRAKVVSGPASTANDEGIVTLFECFDPGAYGLRLYSSNNPVSNAASGTKQ